MALKKQLCTYTKKVIIFVYWFKKIQNITRITNLVFHSNKIKKNKKQNEKKKLTMNHL